MRFPVTTLACVTVLGGAIAIGCICAQAQETKASELLEWFPTLGFPSTKGCSLARVKIEASDEARFLGEFDGRQHLPPVIPRAFVLAEDDASLTILTPDLHVEKLSKKHEAQVHASCERLEFATVAAQVLRELGDKEAAGKREDAWERRLGHPAEIIVFASACEENGLHELAVKLCDAAAKAPRTRQARGCCLADETTNLRTCVEAQLAHATIWQIVLDFGDVSITRGQLLERCERFAKNYPSSKHAEEAAEAVAQLKVMVAEDEAHEKSTKPFDSLTRDEQVAELIYQLRSQHGRQRGQPGACNIAEDERGKESPAHRLLKYGNDAVPRLIEALVDRRFTRSVEFGRSNYYSHHVLRVADCALPILEAIAGRSFYERTHMSASMVEYAKPEDVQRKAREWWTELSTKGEARILAEAAARGDWDSPAQAARLVEKYADQALPPVIEGAHRAKSTRVRDAMVEIATHLEGDASTRFLREELASSPRLAARFIAAEALRSRGEVAAVTSAIEAWTDHASVDIGEWSGFEQEDLAAKAISLGPAAIRAVARCFPGRGVELRYGILGAFAARERTLFFHGKRGPAPDEATREAVDAAIEDLMVSRLDDTDEFASLNSNWDGTPVSHPRMCDMAGYALSKLVPSRYEFDLKASAKKRDEQRASASAAWRAARGFAAAASRPVEVPRVAEEKLAPLLEKVSTAKTDEERSAAVAAIEKLGLGALPGVQARVARLKGEDPARASLELVAQKLAFIVREVEVPSESVKPDAELSRRFDEFRGRVLTSEAFLKLALTVIEKPPAGVTGIKLGVDRSGDDTGVVLRVRLTSEKIVNPRVAGEPPIDRWGWAVSNRVLMGSTSLENNMTSTCYGDGAYRRFVERMAEPLDKVLRAPPDVRVEARLSVVGVPPGE